MEQDTCSISVVWETSSRWKQLSCKLDLDEACTPIVWGSYSLVSETLREDEKECFSTVGTSTLAIVAAAIVFVIIISLIIFFVLRSRRKKQEAYEQAQEAYEDQLDEDANNDAEENGDQEIVIVREARPYVVGYHGVERETPPLAKEPVPAIDIKPPSPFRT